MTIPHKRALCSAIFFVLAASTGSAKAASNCAGSPVSARGEPASFEWLAKTKARANWRARVRATKVLGEAYSVWNRADRREERCTTSARGVVCTFIAFPCPR